ADAGLQTERLLPFEPFDRDHLVLVENGQVDQFLGTVAKVLERVVGDLPDIQPAQELTGEGDYLESKPVAIGRRVAFDVPAPAQRRQEAKQCRSMHAEASGQFGQRQPRPCVVGREDLEDRQTLVERTEGQLGSLNGAGQVWLPGCYGRTMRRPKICEGKSAF